MNALSSIANSLYWIVESQWWVVNEHRPMLKTCAKAGSVTARLVGIWAPIMCFPQWAGVLLGTPAGYATFAARCTAMCIVRKLDGVIPCTRALGICHLLTLGPLGVWLYTTTTTTTKLGEKNTNDKFVTFQLAVCGLCVFLDARDLLLYLLGYPYPCYIRTAARAKAIAIDDKRALEPVSWWNVLIGP